MIALACILPPILLWVFFLAYSVLLANRYSLRIEVKVIGLVVIVIGGLVDIVFNWTIGLLLGVTPDLTFSQKCGRLKRGSDWRAQVAGYFCANWLDPFEIGGYWK